MPPALRLAAVLALLFSPALAELRVSYVDSAPDLITIRNVSACELGPVELVVDLGTSSAGLIFDVSGAGAGYSGHAPLTIAAGGDQVLSIGAVSDGDTRLVLTLDFLAGNGAVSLAVDIDDTSQASEFGRTIISPAEIAGATVHANRGADVPLTARFGPDAVAIVPLEACIA